MPSLNTYLNFNGNCEEAFNFYRSVFGGEFQFVGRFKDMPADADPMVSPEEGEKIMHISLPIGESSVLMGSDTGGEWASSHIQGNNFTISINADNKASADKIFKDLSTGGTVKMPMADTFWGDYFGMLEDKFGINWMMSFNEKLNQGK